MDLSVSPSVVEAALPPGKPRSGNRLEGLRVVGLEMRLADHEIHLRQMAAEGHAHVVTRDVGAQAAGGERQVLLHRGLDPFLRIGRLGHLQRHGGARRGEHGVLHVGDLAQELLCRGELALGGDQVRGGGVARGARFLHVGDGDEAHLEALVGLLELARDGIERGLLSLDVVLGGEHVEVTRGDAQREILLRHAIVGIRLRHDAAGLLEAHQLAPVEDALVELQAPAAASRARR